MRVVVVEAGDKEQILDIPAGLSLMEGLRTAGLPLQGECEGSLACSSCHIWMDGAWFERLDPLSPEEEDLLDVTFNLSPTSRLACQIRISAALDGVRVRIPVPA